VVDRVVLHIGSHKTGSTAIQGTLIDASEELLARGILYPRAGRQGPGHARLAGELAFLEAPVTQAPSHKELLTEVRASDPHTLVLSAENFTPRESSWPADWALHLVEELSPRRVQVVGYVRPQWEFIEASYSQQVKVGITSLHFEDYLTKCFLDPHFDYPRKFGPWRRAFGDHLEVRPFSHEHLVCGDAVADFWSLVGLGSPPELREKYANRRPGAREIVLLRELSTRLTGRQAELPIRKILAKAAKRLRAELSDDSPFSPMDAELISYVAERFSASNKRFVNDYWDREHATFFALPVDGSRLSASSWSLDDASEQEMRLLDDVLGTVPAASQDVPTAEPVPEVAAAGKLVPGSLARRCGVCASPLGGATPDMRFCSTACRLEHYRVRLILEGPPASGPF
jgi:hypothetical protein